MIWGYDLRYIGIVPSKRVLGSLGRFCVRETRLRMRCMGVSCCEILHGMLLDMKGYDLIWYDMVRYDVKRSTANSCPRQIFVGVCRRH